MVGGQYTYAEVPLGFWLRDALGLARNHYDRLGHFAQGFVPAILAREILLRTSPLRGSRWLPFVVVSFCLAFSAFYELIEWWTAVTAGGGGHRLPRDPGRRVGHAVGHVHGADRRDDGAAAALEIAHAATGQSLVIARPRSGRAIRMHRHGARAKAPGSLRRRLRRLLAMTPWAQDDSQHRHRSARRLSHPRPARLQAAARRRVRALLDADHPAGARQLRAQLCHRAGQCARLPLQVYHGLRHDYPWASDRFHTWILEGVVDLYAGFAAQGINYAFWLDGERGASPVAGGEAATREAGRGTGSEREALPSRHRSPSGRSSPDRAALVVTDYFPTFIVPRQIRSLRRDVETPVIAVDRRRWCRWRITRKNTAPPGASGRC